MLALAPGGTSVATISLKDRTDFLVRAVKHAKSTVGKGTETFAPTGDVLRTSSGLTIVPLRQEHAGIPIADAVRPYDSERPAPSIGSRAVRSRSLREPW